MYYYRRPYPCLQNSPLLLTQQHKYGPLAKYKNTRLSVKKIKDALFLVYISF